MILWAHSMTQFYLKIYDFNGISSITESVWNRMLNTCSHLGVCNLPTVPRILSFRLFWSEEKVSTEMAYSIFPDSLISL